MEAFYLEAVTDWDRRDADSPRLTRNTEPGELPVESVSAITEPPLEPVHSPRHVQGHVLNLAHCQFLGPVVPTHGADASTLHPVRGQARGTNAQDDHAFVVPQRNGGYLYRRDLRLHTVTHHHLEPLGQVRATWNR